MFECSRSQGGSPPVPIPASEVSEEVLPLEERSHPCTPLDTAFMPIIWYTVHTQCNKYSILFGCFSVQSQNTGGGRASGAHVLGLAVLVCDIEK